MPRVRKAVFPAAGLGTRFLPVTKAQPKEMLPLIDKPTIQYGIEESLASGIEEVVLVTGGGKRAITDHFDSSPELVRYLETRGKEDLLQKVREVDALTDKLDVVYVQQKEALGLGHAVWTARRQVEGEAFAVLLADDVILGAEPAIQQLIRAHELSGGATVLAARRVPRDQISRYGILKLGQSDGRLHEVVDMVEKPAVEDAPSDLAIFGRYVLTPDVMVALDHAKPGALGEIQLTDAIKQTIGGGRVVALEFEGDYYDTGTVPGYLKANLALALRHPELRDGMLEVVRELVAPEELEPV
ncbi:MAG: UTP--glucose-1-phosphate uridylyltransferase [Candidatus Dormiibacterota bacterium]